MQKYLKLLSAATLVLSLLTSAEAADLSIKVSGVRNVKGKLLISIFDNKAAFTSMKFDKVYGFMAVKPTEDTQEITLHDFPAGTYAIVVLHDENSNQTLDVDKRDFPLEGYAYSRNAGQMAIPSYDQASFIIQKDIVAQQNIKMIYIK